MEGVILPGPDTQIGSAKLLGDDNQNKYYSLCACRRTAFCWIGIFLVESGKFLILDGNFAAGATGKIGNEGNPDLGRHTAPLPSLTPVASMNAESSVMEAER